MPVNIYWRCAMPLWQVVVVGLVLFGLAYILLKRNAEQVIHQYFKDGGFVTLSVLEPGVGNSILTVKVKDGQLWEEAHTGQLDWKPVGTYSLRNKTVHFAGTDWKVTGWTLWPFNFPLNGEPVTGNRKLTIGIPQ